MQYQVTTPHTDRRPGMNPARYGEFGHVQRRGLVLISRKERGSRFGMKMEISRQHAALGTCTGEVLLPNGLRELQFECRGAPLDVGKNGLRQFGDPRQNADLPLCALNLRSKDGDHRHLGSASPARVHLPDQVQRRVNCQSVFVHLVSCITLIRPFYLDNVIREGLSGSFAPYPFSALAGHYDDEGVISLWQRVVNVMQSECRVVSHLRDGYCWRIYLRRDNSQHTPGNPDRIRRTS